MTAPRTIRRSLAAIVEQLELENPVVVTVSDLAAHMNTDESAARSVAYELQRAGWLGRLRTRNSWEFLPGARAGAISSGDRFVEFRARRAVDSSWPGVLAMESAASMAGLAQRQPDREVIALPEGHVLPKSLARDYRSVSLDLGPLACMTTNGLPHWTMDGLIVGIAARPANYRDVAGLGQWLPIAGQQIHPAIVLELLERMNAATRQRVAYLLDLAGRGDAMSDVMDSYPATETSWMGRHVRGGRFHSASQVNDTMLHQFLTVGHGA
jgi:hypothetical protein